jgi:probable phosphoglycerate mutase
LSEEGKAQSAALARKFGSAGARPAAVFAGPLRRHRETADIIVKGMGAAVAVTIETALDEIDYGPWEGKSKMEILETWPEELAAWKKRGAWPVGVFGGSFGALQEKLRAWLGRLPEEGDVLAVASQGTLRALLSVVSPERWREACETGRATDVTVESGHWCELRPVGEGWEIVAWNVKPE